MYAEVFQKGFARISMPSSTAYHPSSQPFSKLTIFHIHTHINPFQEGKASIIQVITIMQNVIANQDNYIPKYIMELSAYLTLSSALQNLFLWLKHSLWRGICHCQNSLQPAHPAVMTRHHSRMKRLGWNHRTVPVRVRICEFESPNVPSNHQDTGTSCEMSG